MIWMQAEKPSLKLILVRNWIVVMLTFIGVYATLPYIAPTFMKLGWTGAANVIYTMYSPMCHQFAFRSIFLYGEQPFYPRASVDSNFQPYEYYAEQYGLVVEPENSLTPNLMFSARDFRGNEQMGYKTTLCARDVSIWGAMFIAGLIYAIPYVRRRIRPVPWWLYIIAGLGPIGLDGFSQLLSYPPLAFWPLRETAPFFRVATGAMFGLMNAWLVFPMLERSFWEWRLELEGYWDKKE